VWTPSLDGAACSLVVATIVDRLPRMLGQRSARLLLPVSVLLYASGCSGTLDATSHDAGHPDASMGSDVADDTMRTPKETSVSDTLTLITEPDQGMTPVYDFIRSAKHTIDMTMYEESDPMVTGLLVAAQKKGLKVRVILDQNLEKRDNTTAYDALSAAGVEVHWADPIFDSTHQKTVTIDGAQSAVMSLNLAPEFYSTSRDFAVITNEAVNVAAIEATFANDLVDKVAMPNDGDGLVWSPTNAETALLGLIAGAKTSLILENEEMSYGPVVTALATAAKSGVDVRVVMVESREWEKNFETLTAAGVKVMVYTPYGSLYIHAKAMVADEGTSSAKAFVGSENFSHASLTSNRELGLILNDAAIVSALHATLASDFAGGMPFAPPDAGGPPPMDAGGPPGDGGDAAPPTDAGHFPADAGDSSLAD
jgi:cardiolipin synthase